MEMEKKRGKVWERASKPSPNHRTVLPPCRGLLLQNFLLSLMEMEKRDRVWEREILEL
jgi:hypothetical protein